MFFVVLAKMKGEMTPEFTEATEKAIKNPPPGIKMHNMFLGASAVRLRNYYL